MMQKNTQHYVQDNAKSAPSNRKPLDWHLCVNILGP